VFVERLLFIIPVAGMNAIVVVLAVAALGLPLVHMLREGLNETAETAEPA
jgi:hypothetical protein